MPHIVAFMKAVTMSRLIRLLTILGFVVAVVVQAAPVQAAEAPPPVKKETPSQKSATPAKPPKPVKRAATPDAPPAAAPAAKPAPQATAATPKAAPTPAAASGGAGEALVVTDMDENLDLPEYPLGARIATGSMQVYTVEEEDTFLDIARHFGLGYIEMRAANPGVDPWAPTPGEQVVIPGFNLLPRTRQEGIVINLGDMRMYYFKKPGAEPLTYALGVGSEGLETPTGDTTIVRKAAHPSWYPTPRMREAKPHLPASVPPGPSNPLGTHAMYLGWPTFLIHGSNKPWGIGRRVSSGCMRMYPEDIVSIFDKVPVGTKVSIVDQPILVGWLDDGLYLEANPSKTQGNDIEIKGTHIVRPLDDAMRAVITKAAGPDAEDRIDWDAVDRALRERRGYPVLIAQASAPRKVVMPRIDTEEAKTEKAENKKEDAPEPAEAQTAVVPTNYN